MDDEVDVGFLEHVERLPIQLNLIRHDVKGNVIAGLNQADLVADSRNESILGHKATGNLGCVQGADLVRVYGAAEEDALEDGPESYG